MQQYIAIDGKGGSGKTFLSELLASALGAAVFHLDTYGNDYEPFIGIPKLVQAVHNAKSDIVIYEGVGAFDARFDRLNPYRILVSVPDSIKRARAERRDIPRSDRPLEEWKKIYDIWKVAEEKYFTDVIQSKADIVVGEPDGEFDIENIVRTIRNRTH